MSKEENVYSIRKVAKTWTSNRLYEILKDGKVVLKLNDESDAKLVVDYLNKNHCKDSGKKGSSKKTGKKSTAKKSTKKSSK